MLSVSSPAVHPQLPLLCLLCALSSSTSSDTAISPSTAAAGVCWCSLSLTQQAAPLPPHPTSAPTSLLFHSLFAMSSFCWPAPHTSLQPDDEICGLWADNVMRSQFDGPTVERHEELLSLVLPMQPLATLGTVPPTPASSDSPPSRDCSRLTAVLSPLPIAGTAEAEATVTYLVDANGILSAGYPAHNGLLDSRCTVLSPLSNGHGDGTELEWRAKEWDHWQSDTADMRLLHCQPHSLECSMQWSGRQPALTCGSQLPYDLYTWSDDRSLPQPTPQPVHAMATLKICWKGPTLYGVADGMDSTSPCLPAAAPCTWKPLECDGASCHSEGSDSIGSGSCGSSWLFSSSSPAPHTFSRSPTPLSSSHPPSECVSVASHSRKAVGGVLRSGLVRLGWRHRSQREDFPFPTPAVFIFRHRLAARRVEFESYGFDGCRRCRAPFTSASNAEAHHAAAIHGHLDPVFVRYDDRSGIWQWFRRARRPANRH